MSDSPPRKDDHAARSTAAWQRTWGAIALGVLALAGAAWWNGRYELETATVQVAGESITVELAATPEHRAKGLMYRESLRTNEGMLFLYPEEESRSFWMKDTRIPLSIAFADDKGKIVRIADMNPLDKNGVKSLYPAQYALEMNQGWFAEHDIKAGDRIENIPTDIKVK